MAMVQVAFRMSGELAERLEAIAAALSVKASGTPITRSDAARLSLERGAAVLETELGLVPSPVTKPHEEA